MYSVLLFRELCYCQVALSGSLFCTINDVHSSIGHIVVVIFMHQMSFCENGELNGFSGSFAWSEIRNEEKKCIWFLRVLDF